TGVAVVTEDIGVEGFIQSQAATTDEGTGTLVEAGYMSDGESDWNHVVFQDVGAVCTSGEGINMGQAAVSEGAGVVVEPGVTSCEGIGRNLTVSVVYGTGAAGVPDDMGVEDLIQN
ncbi:MAG: hypothetical protein ACKPKO_04040, partial [Candidatus Fonsibacter sp.]